MCPKKKLESNTRPNTLNKEMMEIFLSCSRTIAVHQRNSIILKELYENSLHEDFWISLKNNILRILMMTESSQPAEKLLKFFGTFCALLKPKAGNGENSNESIEYVEHPLLTDIISFALEVSDAKEDLVRIRSCKIINVILDQLADLSIDICEKLEDNLIVRLQDPKSVVRQQAVIALRRLQDPHNAEDSIINELIRLMNSDSFPKVRQLCVENICARKDVVGHILMRIRDQDPSVRLAAFKRLTGFAGFLKIHEKQLILHSGFVDKSEKVHEFVQSSLIKAWLDYYSDDILKFMKSLRLDADEKDIRNTVEIFESTLKEIFKMKSGEKLIETLPLTDRLVPFEQLNWETVSYWRIYVQYLSQENEDELEKVVPELIYFCKYVKQFYTEMSKEVTPEEFLEQQFILNQLFLMIKTYDFGDVINRNCLNKLVSHILQNVVLIADVVKTVVSSLECSIPNVTQRSQFVTELISEILYPMNTDEAEKMEQEKRFRICQISVKLNELKTQQECAISDQNFMEADRLKHEMNDLDAQLATIKNIEPEHQQIERKTDILTTIRCLDIATAILLSPKVNYLTSTLKALREDFIQELLIHENDSVRVKAFECYGLCCIVDKETAATGIHIFSTPIFAYKSGEECDTQTLLVCIAAVVDILRIYGPQLMAAAKNEELSESMEEKEEAVFAGGTSLTSILQGLVDLMDDDQDDIQEQAGRALCQLVLSNRIVSPSLISRLVLKWCNPASDNECNRLKQIIGYTLQNIPLIPDCTEQLIESVFLTIKALYAAPRISPLADVNVENIAKFLLALCKVSENAEFIHKTIATTIIKEMTDNPASRMSALYSKMLLLLDIPNSEGSIEELLNMCDNLRDLYTQKQIVNNLIKFTTKLNDKASEQTTGSGTTIKPETIAEEDEENDED